MDIGELINKGLRRKGITQTRLAEILGVKPPSVAAWISGKSSPKAEKLVEIINILDLKDEFFPNNEGESQQKEDSLAKRVNILEQQMDKMRELYKTALKTKKLGNKRVIVEEKDGTEYFTLGEIIKDCEDINSKKTKTEINRALMLLETIGHETIQEMDPSKRPEFLEDLKKIITKFQLT